MKKIAILFPGQGAQKQGMGKSFYDNYEVARNTFERIDNTLQRSISKLCFEGTEEVLKQTINTQPALLAVEVAGFEALKSEIDIKPAYFAGHSLGEYGALYASGTLTLENCFRAIEARANAMHNACESATEAGAMAAVLGVDSAIIKGEASKITNYVDVANFNEPNQTVITGTEEGVTELSAVLKEKGAKRIVPLAVSGAFHSKLMAPAAAEFESAFKNIEINEAHTPVVTNTDAAPTTKPEDFRKKEVEQISSSVQWVKTIQFMLSEGVNTFIEIGEGKVLSGLCKKMCPSETLILNISDKESLDIALEELKK